MVTVTLNNINNLNDSLQVGDLVYTTSTQNTIANNLNSDLVTTTNNVVGGSAGNTNIVGILRRITVTGNTVVLDVDETLFFNTVVPQSGDFLMFSKYNQTRGDVLGYYAQAKFKNDSREKAELFSVGSEVVINSK